MRSARLGLLLALLAVLLTGAQPALAQSRTLVWEVYDVALTVLPNGDLRVVERQRIRFTSGTFTYGYATIPLSKTEGIDGVAISEPGGPQYQETSFGEDPYTFTTSTYEGDLEIRWFFPPTTNSTRTFDLAYTAHGAIRIHESGDKLQWFAIDNQRDFPIESASVTVTLPSGAQFLSNPDSAGVEAAWGISPNGSSVTYIASRSLAPSDVMEIGVEFTHGVIPAAPPGWQAAQDATEAYDLQVKPFVDLVLGVLAALLILGGPAFILLMWYLRGRDPQVGPVPEYVAEPPDELPPGILGTLLDERADMRDVVATMIDLARKGYMSIEETERAGVLSLGGKDFVFRRLDKPETGLEPVEREVLAGIFRGNKNEVRLNDLRNKFYTQLPGIQRRLYEAMVSRGFFRSNPDTTRKLWRGIGIAMFIGAIFLGGFVSAGLSNISSLLPCVFGGLGLTGLVAVGFGGSMPAKTRKGAEAAARWAAFRNYLTRIEKLADISQSSHLFDKFLPYAIAFGIKDSWIFKFTQQPTTPIPGWYMPYGWGRPVATSSGSGRGGGVASPTAPGGRIPAPGGGLQGMSDSLAGGLTSMSDGLTRLLNSTGRVMGSVPSSSGHSGGGGFSGGGFHGGGGGGGGGRGFG
jgi:uncharacterized membrane protein